MLANQTSESKQTPQSAPDASVGGRTDAAAGLMKVEERSTYERGVREAADYFALVGHAAAAQYQRDLAQVVSARCGERDPRARAALVEVERALTAAADNARAAGNLAAQLIENMRALDGALASLQTVASAPSR